jgi:hypothetical protein
MRDNQSPNSKYFLAKDAKLAKNGGWKARLKELLCALCGFARDAFYF